MRARPSKRKHKCRAYRLVSRLAWKGNAMEQYVGLDVSQEQTSVRVLDGSGRVIW